MSGQAYERPLTQVAGFLAELDATGAPAVGKERRILAALGPRMLELAAERSIGGHPYFTTVEHTQVARKVLGEGPVLAPEVAVVIDADPAAARAAARAYMAGYLSLPNYTSNLLRTGWTDDDVGNGGSDRLVDALVPWGSAQAVAARLIEHREAGADHVCIQVVGGDGTFPAASYAELAEELDLEDHSDTAPRDL
jgi:probable F420-dependent oxidoreductase